jgi:hypothetical protein
MDMTTTTYIRNRGTSITDTYEIDPSYAEHVANLAPAARWGALENARRNAWWVRLTVAVDGATVATFGGK